VDSLVLELQRKALNPAISVSDLLRSALVVASKLNISDYEIWVKNELNGYTSTDNSPSYREIDG